MLRNQGIAPLIWLAFPKRGKWCPIPGWSAWRLAQRIVDPADRSMAPVASRLQPSAPTAPPSLPGVRLEVRPARGRAALYEVGDGGFLVGSVPGCDLRLPGANLPPVV